MASALSRRVRDLDLVVRRDTDAAVLAGVLAGLARFLVVDLLVVRLVVVVAALGTWLMVPVYAAAWALLQPGRSEPLIDEPATQAGRDVGFALLTAGLVGLARGAGAGLLPTEVLWPVAVIVIGLGLAARRTGTDISVEDLRSGRFGSVRITGGIAVAGVGVATLFAANVSTDALRDGLVASGLVLAGVLVVFGPWLYLLARDLTAERRARVRADERSAVAAHLHDSVLQTLALIQRTDDAERARALARTQERDLRRWLYEPGDAQGAPSEGDLPSALTAAAEEVEDRYGLTVETVIVGTGPRTEAGDALTGAVREALVNAARWSGASQVSLYVEIGDSRALAFVRDTGAGFDPDRVDEGHRGIADSILGRMRRHGGEASVTSTPGEGTEVRCEISWPPPDPAPRGTS